MELRHLRYFVAVAEEENVSRAALKLHVSQPALSRQIRDLEDDIGFLLLARSAKSVRLTDAGRSFLGESRAVLQRVEEAVKTARATAFGGDELHVGYAMSPTVRLLPQTLRAFQAEMPKVRVKLHDLTTEQMQAGLRAGTLQIALMVCSNPASMRGLKSEKLARVAMCLAVAPQHPFARQRSVKLAELAQCPLLGLNRTEYPDYEELLEAIFAPAGIKPRMAEEHDSISSLIAAVESGNGAAVVTESIGCIAGPRLKLTRISPPPPPLIVVAAWLEKGLSPTGKQFLKCAREAGVKE